MVRLRWSETAVRDFEAALSYIAAENPAAARSVRARILAALANLEIFSLGLPAPKGAQKLYIPKTPYFAVFRRDEKGDISIRAFVHASRNWELIDWENM